MRGATRLSAACALGFLVVSQHGAATPSGEGAAGFGVLDDSVQMSEKASPIPKSAVAQTLGARATVTSSSTLFGGFEIRSTALVYFLIRGNSLGTLGITQAYLDAPRVRIYNAQGQDIALDVLGNVGFNACLSSNTFAAPVRNFYALIRGQPPADRDSCNSGTLSPGVYTFSVTPSIPGVTTVTTTSIPPFGEVLFEVTLNP